MVFLLKCGTTSFVQRSQFLIIQFDDGIGIIKGRCESVVQQHVELLLGLTLCRYHLCVGDGIVLVRG